MHQAEPNVPTQVVRRLPRDAAGDKALTVQQGREKVGELDAALGSDPTLDADTKASDGVGRPAPSGGKPAPNADSALAELDSASRLMPFLQQLPPVGAKFLGFQLIAELGKGASGKVYLAKQGDLAGRYVALKVSADMFDESQAMAQLQHTNVMPIYSIHRVPPFLAVCMPFFGSATLGDVLATAVGRPQPPSSGQDLVEALFRRRKSLTPADHAPWLVETQTALRGTATTFELGPASRGHDATPLPAPPRRLTTILKMLQTLDYVQAVLWIASRVTEGLAHAHERGILHLDLKPANILVSDEGQPMLLDFNLARDTKGGCPSTALVGGTLPYMSPEQLCDLQTSGQTIDARSDLYSFGVILYELLTWRAAFPVPKGRKQGLIAHLLENRQRPPRVRRWNRMVPLAVESIVRHCLEPDPARRYQSAHELNEDLHRQLHHLPLKWASNPSFRERGRKWARRHPRLISSSTMIIILETLSLMGLAGWTFLRQPDDAPGAAAVGTVCQPATLEQPCPNQYPETYP
jgi:serine/threonine protein kinase